jgi:hypothetical protein
MTTTVLLSIITAGIAFTFGMIRLGIKRLVKGQDDAKKDGQKRVDTIREDIKTIAMLQQKHDKHIAIHDLRIQTLEEKNEIKYGRRKDDD